MVKKHSSWLSLEALHTKRLRRNFERRWLSTGLEVDRIKYRKQCRLCNKLIIDSRRKHFVSKLEGISDSKNLWKHAKELLHTSPPLFPSTVALDNSICDKFSHFFTSKVTSLQTAVQAKVSTLSPNSYDYSLFTDARSTDPSFCFLPIVSETEVKLLLGSLPAKSSRLDFISTSLLKSCSKSFPAIITRLANLSLIFISRLTDGVSALKLPSLTL